MRNKVIAQIMVILCSMLTTLLSFYVFNLGIESDITWFGFWLVIWSICGIVGTTCLASAVSVDIWNKW
jgi:hypothetical protein